MDWIEGFLDYTDGTPSPENFRLWCGITAISGALERRLYSRTAKSAVYPNIYTLLVSSPGIGKSEAIKIVEEFWRSTKKLFVAPNNVTKAALMDALERADRKILKNGRLIEYHTLVVAADELSVLAPAHDLEFFGVLSRLYDNPKSHSEERRHSKKELELIHPQLVMLIGAQPGFMAHAIPEEAWQQGFTARIIMIYAAQGVYVPLFKNQTPKSKLFAELSAGITAMTDLEGEMHWSHDAQVLMERLAEERLQPAPIHSKLVNYNTRRVLQTLKLSMISCISRQTGSLEVQVQDIERARDWLFSAEARMPDIFREMVQKSDGQLLMDLHQFAWQQYSMQKKKPLHEAALLNFLASRSVAEKSFRLLELAERTSMFDRIAGTKTYIPRALDKIGVE